VDQAAGDGWRSRNLIVNPDRRSFEKRLRIYPPDRVRLEFTDTDNVKSLRHIVIQPKEDRRGRGRDRGNHPQDAAGLMCTAMAMVPFSGGCATWKA